MATSLTPVQAGARTRNVNPWWYVITGFLTFVFGTSTVNVIFNVLTKPVTADLGWDRSVLSNGLSIVTVMTGVSILVLGFLVDRFGPRKPTVPMALAFGVGLMLLGIMPDNQMAFYAICVLIGAGAGAVNPVAHATVVTAWFTKQRGLALGVLMAGLGACGVLMPYLGNFFLGLGGWRMTFIVIGALCTVIPASVYAFVTRMPASHSAARAAARAEGRTLGEGLWTIAKKYRQFWLLSIAIFLVSSATFGLMSQVIPMATDKGIAQTTAVAVLSVLSLSSLGARLVVGYLLDRFFAPIIGSVIFALCGVGVFFMIGSSNLGLLFMAAVLIGLGLGAEGDLAGYMAGRYFPQHSYGRVLGFIYFVYAQGAAFGIFLLGQAFRISGSYVSVMWLIIGMVAVGIVCLLSMGSYRFGLNHQPITGKQSATQALVP